MLNYHKQDMASVDWLATHFFAKSSQRFRQFAALPIHPGDRVLDLCCGPGLYTRYAVDLVGPDGHVTGLDHDPASLDFAHRYLSIFPFKNWDLLHADAASGLPDLAQFDVIMLMNCIGYFAKPDEFLRTISGGARRGAKIIVKDFDMESICLYPIPADDFARLITAAKAQNAKENPLKFDNFFGRNVPFLHTLYNFSHHEENIWSQMMTYPFNRYETEYIWRNIEALILQAEAICSGRTLRYFRDQFCSTEKPFFSIKTALFIENEYLAVLTV